MCPKAFFLIVSRSRMMFHAEEVLSEFFREREWKGVKSRSDEIGHVVPCKALRACKAAMPRVKTLRVV